MSHMSQCDTRYNDDGTVTFIGKTLLHQTPFEVTVKVEDLDRYNNTATLMQNCFPYLTNEQRELLISGCNEQEWRELYGRKPK